MDSDRKALMDALGGAKAAEDIQRIASADLASQYGALANVAGTTIADGIAAAEIAKRFGANETLADGLAADLARRLGASTKVEMPFDGHTIAKALQESEAQRVRDIAQGFGTTIAQQMALAEQENIVGTIAKVARDLNMKESIALAAQKEMDARHAEALRALARTETRTIETQYQAPIYVAPVGDSMARVLRERDREQEKERKREQAEEQRRRDAQREADAVKDAARDAREQLMVRITVLVGLGAIGVTAWIYLAPIVFEWLGT